MNTASMGGKHHSIKKLWSASDNDTVKNLVLFQHSWRWFAKDHAPEGVQQYRPASGVGIGLFCWK